MTGPGRSIRTLIRIAAVAASMPMCLASPKAADATCVPISLTTIAMSDPLDRSEEPLMELACSVAPVAIPKQAAARGEPGKTFDGVTIQAMPAK